MPVGGPGLIGARAVARRLFASHLLEITSLIFINLILFERFNVEILLLISSFHI